MITLAPWWLLAAVGPVLWLGGRADRWRPLRATGVPPVVVGALGVALLVLATHLTARPVHFETRTLNHAWLWLVTAEPRLATQKPRPLYAPFATAFFACIGLCATAVVARRTTWQLIFLLAAATLLAAAQNGVSYLAAHWTGAGPTVAMACGSLTLTGGPATTDGFADELARAGYDDIGPYAEAASTFGIVVASLVAGAMGLAIVRLAALRHTDAPPDPRLSNDAPPPEPATLHAVWRVLREPSARPLLHVGVLLACIKAGVWVRYGYDLLKAEFGWHASFPVYMGPLLVAIVVRNAFDASVPGMLKTRAVEAIAGVMLRVYLAMYVAGVDLAALRHVGVPMALVLAIQTVVALLFCTLVTWPLLGRTYDAAVMAVGHLGFALGNTPNAVASMDRVTEICGRAPRAILAATIVGGFLVDITNSFLIQQQLPISYAPTHEHTAVP